MSIVRYRSDLPDFASTIANLMNIVTRVASGVIVHRDVLINVTRIVQPDRATVICRLVISERGEFDGQATSLYSDGATVCVGRVISYGAVIDG